MDGTILLAVAAMSLVTLDTVQQLAALAEVRRNRRFAEVVWRVHTEGPRGMAPPRRPRSTWNTARPAPAARPAPPSSTLPDDGVYAK